MTELLRSDDDAPKRVPEFDLADRLRKALRVSGVGVQGMADYLEVERGTVSTWINGRVAPSAQTVRLFAMRTGVSYDWLRHGWDGAERRGGPTDSGADSRRNLPLRLVSFEGELELSAPIRSWAVAS
jgi:transcriptional regulator with XRE-family HTH domain